MIRLYSAARLSYSLTLPQTQLLILSHPHLHDASVQYYAAPRNILSFPFSSRPIRNLSGPSSSFSSQCLTLLIQRGLSRHITQSTNERTSHPKPLGQQGILASRIFSIHLPIHMRPSSPHVEMVRFPGAGSDLGPTPPKRQARTLPRSASFPYKTRFRAAQPPPYPAIAYYMDQELAHQLQHR